MRLPEDPRAPLQINIVPMIDVVFAVLAFFILSSLFLTRNEGMTVSLPGARHGEAQPQRQVTVTLDASGATFIGDQPVADGQLLEAVQTLVPHTGGGLVVIRADQSVSHGRVVAIMDRLRALEGIQLAIATDPLVPQP
ncbi:MAG TPA: biopolymer transporter ExbD [Leptolyngbyaceae cyanobacterium M65_K2018_010]|nr:biopolymer transporter ExbD [Leptolyngbyaceae cyanobacterium M65_K2018_010]